MFAFLKCVYALSLIWRQLKWGKHLTDKPSTSDQLLLQQGKDCWHRSPHPWISMQPSSDIQKYHLTKRRKLNGILIEIKLSFSRGQLLNGPAMWRPLSDYEDNDVCAKERNVNFNCKLLTALHSWLLAVLIYRKNVKWWEINTNKEASPTLMCFSWVAQITCNPRVWPVDTI